MAFTVKDISAATQRIQEASPGMWDDFPVTSIPGRDVLVYHNDFVSWVPDEWTITEVNASTQTLLDEADGVLRLTPAGAENDGSEMQLGGTGDGETTGECFAPAVGRILWFETRIRSLDADQNDWVVGLHVQDTTTVAGLGADGILFQVVDESASINAISRAASVSSTEAAVATMTDSVFFRLGFKVNGTSNVQFYVNDVLTATNTTNIPTGLMKLTLGHLSGEASANTFDIDYVTVAQTLIR
jgi:hypothetical protein